MKIIESYNDVYKMMNTDGIIVMLVYSDFNLESRSFKQVMRMFECKHRKSLVRRCSRIDKSNSVHFAAVNGNKLHLIKKVLKVRQLPQVVCLQNKKEKKTKMKSDVKNTRCNKLNELEDFLNAIVHTN
jgi:hypothetical protein